MPSRDSPRRLTIHQKTYVAKTAGNGGSRLLIFAVSHRPHLSGLAFCAALDCTAFALRGSPR
jgi:hypothetical protein